MTVESIQVTTHAAGYTATAVLKVEGLSAKEFEGEGRTLSEAIVDLGEQIEQLEMEL